MYSPKIKEELIERLYPIAKAQGRFMTDIVNEILDGYIKQEENRKKEHGKFYLNK